MAFKKKIRGKLSRYYYVDFWVGQQGDPAAIHVNKSTRSANYDEACKQEEQWKVDAEEQFFQIEGDLLNAGGMTISDALEHVNNARWQHNKTGFKPVRHIEKIIDLVGDVPLTNLSGKRGYVLISKVRHELLGMDNGRGKIINKETVDRYMASVKTLLNDMQRKFHLYDDLIIPYIEMFNVKRGRTKVLETNEEVKLFKLMKDDRNFSDLCKVLLDTGMRLSEALNMRYDKEIFLKHKRITLDPAMIDIKNKKVRSIPMTEVVFKILRGRKLLQEEKPFPYRADVCGHKFARYRAAMGIDNIDFTLHMLRHSCTTRLIQQGVDQAVVQKWMGHSDAKMTTHYTQLGVEDMREGAALLDKVHEGIYNKSISAVSGENQAISGV